MYGSVAQTVHIAGLNSNYTFSSTAECTQAVNAANYAKGQGTEIYSVSYNSGSSGCASDPAPYYNDPCLTMQNIASTPLSQYFFSVPLQNEKGTQCPNAISITYLDQVFTTIAGDLETSRLVPGNVTATWSVVPN